MAELTNRQKAATDQEFRKACEEAGVYPSRQRYRQWSKLGESAFRTKPRLDSYPFDRYPLK